MAENTENNDAAGKTGKTRTFRQMAERQAKTTYGLLKRNEAPKGQEAVLSVQLANVYATLALADAVSARDNADG